jgi:hypothetical protein
MAQTAETRYLNLTLVRENFLKRARECSQYTIPHLMPPSGLASGAELETPWSSIGARGVNTLAAKLLLALLPPGTSFFRLRMSRIVQQELQQAAPDDPTVPSEFEKALTDIESEATSLMESKGLRSPFFQALRQLIVAGNVLLFIMPKGKLRFYKMDQYVVKRDGAGDVLDIVLKEELDRETVPEVVREIIDRKRSASTAAAAAPGEEESDEEPIFLYTRIMRDGKAKKFRIYQEVLGERVPKSEGTYPVDRCPWLALRWQRLDGEDYGRGHCEEYLGDLRSAEGGQGAVMRFADAAAKILFLVEPGTATKAEKLAKARSGDFVPGRKEDVNTLQLDKFADFQVVAGVTKGVEDRLKSAFLINETRQAERVTAEEIRYTAQELDSSLGGTYSILAEEVQRPLLSVMLFQMQKDGSIPSLPDKSVSLQIVTGLEALGRGADLNKLDVFVAGAAQALGPQAVQEYINPGVYFTTRATKLALNVPGLVRSEEDVQAARQAAQQQSMVDKAIPGAVKLAGDAAAQPQPQEVPA